jgi:hypothetical protein
MCPRVLATAVLMSLAITESVAQVSAGAAASASSPAPARSTDVAAMELARTAQTAAETIAVDHGGSYANVTRRSLHRLEPLIPIAPDRSAWLSAASGTKHGLW